MRCYIYWRCQGETLQINYFHTSIFTERKSHLVVANSPTLLLMFLTFPSTLRLVWWECVCGGCISTSVWLCVEVGGNHFHFGKAKACVSSVRSFPICTKTDRASSFWAQASISDWHLLQLPVQEAFLSQGCVTLFGIRSNTLHYSRQMHLLRMLCCEGASIWYTSHSEK